MLIKAFDSDNLGSSNASHKGKQASILKPEVSQIDPGGMPQLESRVKTLVTSNDECENANQLCLNTGTKNITHADCA